MRRRMLSPGFFENPDLAELDPHTRLLFAGLWCAADREGRLPDDARRIRAAVFPYEPKLDVAAMLGQLADNEFIVRYVVNDTAVIWVPHFLEHQKPHDRETPSKLPAHPARSTQGAPKADLGDAKVAGVVTGTGSESGFESESVTNDSVGDSDPLPVVTGRDKPASRTASAPGDAEQAITSFEEKVRRAANGDERDSLTQFVQKYGTDETIQAIAIARDKHRVEDMPYICGILKSRREDQQVRDASVNAWKAGGLRSHA